MRDVVLYNPGYPTFVLNTGALKYLDKITTGNIPLRRKLASILTRIINVIAELKPVANRGLAKRLFGLWWAERLNELADTDLETAVLTNIANHVHAVVKESF